MKIYAEKNKETSSVEMMFNYRELKTLVDALVNFESKIKQYKSDNEGKENLGFTHMHFQDYDRASEESRSDIVFYVNLDED